MARTDDDIHEIEFTLRGKISIDLERLEEDPIWNLTCFSCPDENPQILLKQYLSHYIIREKLLSDMPCTNGPGELFLISEIT